MPSLGLPCKKKSFTYYKSKVMERIVIQVDDSSGKIYNQLSRDKQQQISEAVNLLLKKAANDATAIEYRNMLDEFGNKAIANGLTPEILEGLLKQND
jgi:hypothetical protein